MKTLESQHETEVMKRTGLQGETKELMDQVAELNTKEKQLLKVRFIAINGRKVQKMKTTGI